MKQTETEYKNKPEQKDLYSIPSEKKGLKGLFESALRKAAATIHVLSVIPMFAVAGICFGSALFPAVLIFRWIYQLSHEWNFFLSSLAIATAIGLSYFIFALSLITVIPIYNFIFRAKLKPWRGPYYSFEAVTWYIHNGLTYLARYTILELLTPSPFNHWFYQMLGMKIGRHSQINTTHISDPSLITIGSKVTIGGSVTIVGHYGQGGYLVLAHVVIEDNVTVGLKASIMGGVHIGKGAKILPHSVVLPKTQIPAGETWGGVPARKMSLEELKQTRADSEKEKTEKVA